MLFNPSNYNDITLIQPNVDYQSDVVVDTDLINNELFENDLNILNMLDKNIANNIATIDESLFYKPTPSFSILPIAKMNANYVAFSRTALPNWEKCTIEFLERCFF